MMKIYAIFNICSLLIFVLAGINARATSDGPAEWVERASNATNIRMVGSPTFDLRARARILGAGSDLIEGTYRLIWNSPAQWREEIHFPGYERLRIGGTGAYWQRRNLPYEPVRIWQLDKILGNLYHLEMQPKEKFGKGHERKVGQEKQNCFDISNEHGFRLMESCFDQTSGVLLQVSAPDSKDRLGGLTRIEYLDYHDWSGKKFPHAMRALIGKLPVVEIYIDEINTAQQVSPTTFTALPDDVEWTTCEKPEGPSILEQPRPQYPAEARAQGKQGTAAIYVVIENAGNISHEKVVVPTFPSLDAAALNAVSHWRYKPATCNGLPYSLENMIFVTFMIGN